MNFSLQDKPCSNQMADSRFPTAVISHFYSAVYSTWADVIMLSLCLAVLREYMSVGHSPSLYKTLILSIEFK